MQALVGGLLFHSYGLYVVELEEEFRWSKTRLSIAFSLARVEDGLLGPLQGWALDRFGPRAVMRLGIVIFGLGFFAFSQVNSLPMFYLTFVFTAVGAALSGFLSVTTAIVSWFVRRRTLAIGIALVGVAAGGLSQPGIAWVMEAYSWRTMAVLSGVIVFVVGLPATQLVRHQPEPYGLLPDGDTAEQIAAREAAEATAAGRDDTSELAFSAGEAIRTRAFWVISLAHAAALLVVSAVMVHFVAHVEESLGYSTGRAATLITFLTAMTIIGQMLGGWLGDRFSSRLIIGLCMLGHAAGLLLLTAATGLWLVLAFAVLHGLAWGIRGPVILGMRAEYFGRKAFGKIMGFSSLIVMFGMFVGPVLAGATYDATGNYQVGFTILALVAGGGSLLMLLAQRPTPPQPADLGCVRTPAAERIGSADPGSPSSRRSDLRGQ